MKSINQLYLEYLDRVGLEEGEMPPIQKKEIKRAFFAGCGSIILELPDMLENLTDDEGVVAIAELEKEMGDFWFDEIRSSEMSTLQSTKDDN
jgi:hypothetical protein